MTDAVRSLPASADRPLRRLLPLVAIVFLGMLSVGAPLPALSLYVHDRLGFSPIVVGIVIGLQSLATILTRHAAGVLCDRFGPRRGVALGLPIAALAGCAYLASDLVPAGPGIKLAVLLAGRLVMGWGESLFIVGAMAWGISRVGPARTGLVMSWQGIALYGALGLGAPLGLAADRTYGFSGPAGLAIVAPLLAALIALPLPAVAGGGGGRVPFHRVVGLIWRPGLVQALATVPFAAMASFLPLDFAARGWPGAGIAILVFGLAYILVRLFGTGLPDRFGPLPVAGVSLAVEAVGQATLWLATTPLIAGLGAAMTGLGFSLLFPTMGVAATRRVPPEARGRAVGNFIAFFDLALALTGPLVGLVVGGLGYATAFLVGGVASLLALTGVAAMWVGER